MNKKVLIALPNDKLGGAEQFLKMVAVHFFKLNYEVTVCFLKNKEGLGWEDQKENLKLIYTPAKTEKLGVFYLLKLVFKRRNIQYGYVFTSHVHLTGFLGLLRYVGLLKTHSFIGRESTSVFKRYKGFKLFTFKVLYSMGYSSLDLLICQTTLMKEQLVNNLTWIEEKTKVEVIPNPIDYNIILKNQQEELSTNFNFPYIVSAGRLIPEKGFDLLIKAFKEVKNTHKEIKLIVLGEGNQKEYLLNLVEELNLQQDVIFSGFVKNVYPYFKNAQVCVVSSRVEGFPNVLLQMMSQNTKVVSTLCAGDIDLLEGVEKIPVENISELSKAIINVLTTNTKENRKLFDKELKRRDITTFVSNIKEKIL